MELAVLLDDLTSDDEPRAEAAAVQIALFGETALPHIQHLASSSDPNTRWWAIRAAAEFEHPAAQELLTAALKDQDPEIQACAALGLRSHPSVQAIEDLIRLLDSQDQLLSRLAGDALTAIGKPAIPALIAYLESTETTSHLGRLAAVRALAQIGEPESISTLFKIYQDGSAMMQHWAEEGLNKMGIGMVFFDPH